MIRCTLTPNLTVRKISDEFFILDRNTGFVHTFNGTGGFIWERLYNGDDFENVVKSLHSAYGIAIDTARKDVFEFLLKIEKTGILTIS